MACVYYGDKFSITDKFCQLICMLLNKNQNILHIISIAQLNVPNSPRSVQYPQQFLRSLCRHHTRPLRKRFLYPATGPLLWWRRQASCPHRSWKLMLRYGHALDFSNKSKIIVTSVRSSIDGERHLDVRKASHFKRRVWKI